MKSRHPDIPSYKGHTPGWPPPKTLTLNGEQHVLLHILPDGNIEGGQDPYILKTVISRGFQGVVI